MISILLIRIVILLLMLTISCQAGGRRVIDRFPNSKLTIPSRCLFGIPDAAKRFINSGSFGWNRKQETSAIARFLAPMNCSLSGLPYAGVGQMDGNGTYDGVAGYLQRNEIDSLIFFTRLDYFPIVIGHFATQGFPADVVILSRKIAPYIENYSLLGLWMSSFDYITVAYVLISVFLFLTVFTLTESLLILRSHESLLTRILKKTHVNIFKVFFSFVDQENFDASSNSGRIMVWFFNLFLLFFVHGFVLGSMGADLVALIDPPVINSMYDFSNTSHTQPVVIKQLHLTGLLKQAQPGTELWHLKTVLESNKNDSIVNYDMSQNIMEMQQSAYNLLQEVNNSTKAVIISEYIYNTNMKSGACELIPAIAENIRSSQKMFFPGVFSFIMSLNIDPHLRQVSNYIWATMCETGQIRARTAQAVRNNIHSLTNKPYKGKVCDNSLIEKDQSISSFDWKTFDLVFKLYAVMLLVPAVCLLMEMHKKVNRRVVRSLFRSIRFIILFPCMSVLLLIVSALSLCKKYPTAISSSVIRMKSTRTAPAVHQ